MSAKVTERDRVHCNLPGLIFSLPDFNILPNIKRPKGDCTGECIAAGKTFCSGRADDMMSLSVMRHGFAPDIPA
ncbi:hypothetical protein [Rhodovulum sp. YEN HP10]|uniref:hypothetical protein n=1 Tax=Rhodovulum sp. HP10 TaxID=3387397 RepID=UPI0039E15DEA